MQSLLQKSCFSSHTLFKTWAWVRWRQMQKHRSTWRGNIHQPTDFFRDFGLVWYPKQALAQLFRKGSNVKVTPHFPFGGPKFPWKEKSMGEWFPVQVILQDQLGSFSQIKFLGSQTYWSFFSQSSPCDSGAQSSQSVSLFFSLGLWLPVCLKNPSHELHQNQFQPF